MTKCFSVSGSLWLSSAVHKQIYQEREVCLKGDRNRLDLLQHTPGRSVGIYSAHQFVGTLASLSCLCCL